MTRGVDKIRNREASEGTILILSRYGPVGASSRTRLFEYLPFLRARGLAVQVQSLLSDDYLTRKYRGEQVGTWTIGAAYWKRLKFLLRSSKSAAIWLEKELWPYLPFGIESRVLAGRKIIVDIDDAVFHNYDQHKSAVVRRLLGQKLDLIFGISTLVTAGSAYLAKRALDARAPRVEVLPTVVNFNSYAAVRRVPSSGFTVGWIGSPATQGLLSPVIGVLAEVLSGEADRFVTVGSKFGRRLFPKHEEWQWGRDTEVRQVSQFSVGIMPVPDRPFERGKCGYKLIQYMASGIPVVASPVGENKSIVRHGESGFLVETLEEWRKALIALKQDGGLRIRMGEMGQRIASEQYSLEKTGPKVANWMAEVANGPLPRGE